MTAVVPVFIRQFVLGFAVSKVMFTFGGGSSLILRMCDQTGAIWPTAKADQNIFVRINCNTLYFIVNFKLTRSAILIEARGFVIEDDGSISDPRISQFDVAKLSACRVVFTFEAFRHTIV